MAHENGSAGLAAPPVQPLGLADAKMWVVETWTPGGMGQVLVWSMSYIVLVTLAIMAMDKAPTFKPNRDMLNVLSALHNSFMSLFSAYMFFGVVMDTYTAWRDEGFELSLLYCDSNEVYKRGTEHWYYMFFISKFFEYIDTAFLVANRKYSHTVGWYLQVYHHATTASIAWVAWFHNVPFSWFGIMSNCFVHIVMYAYFAVAVYQKKVRKFGHLVTYIQLAQFYCAVGSAFFTLYYHNIRDGAAGNAECNSSHEGIWFVWFMYLSYLIFFLVFHQVRSMNMKKREAEKARLEAAKGGAGKAGSGSSAGAAAQAAFAPCMMNQGAKKTD